MPNFSEGCDQSIINQIAAGIQSVEGVKLLSIDSGKAANRTVMTFVGEPDNVIEAAFRAVTLAGKLIDMSEHRGVHPRFGATDVCPLVPISGVSMEETVRFARRLAARIGDELDIPVYCYEKAAFSEERRNLASVRSGGYEGLEEKLKDPFWKPDFGMAKFNSRSGAIAVGARNFLVAYNVNLNTKSVQLASELASIVREKGRVQRFGSPGTEQIMSDKGGKLLYVAGTLKSVKAIGWFIEDYGIAQISMNLTDLSVTPVHLAFEEVCRQAEARGIQVTGSEVVGLVPLSAMLDAGRYFMHRQKTNVGLSDDELIEIAVRVLGLNDLYPFKPDEKIIEYGISKHI